MEAFLPVSAPRPAAQTDNRRQTFSNQCCWSAATTRPGYKTTLTCGGHKLHEDTRAATEPVRTHAVQFESVQTRRLQCTHTHTLLYVSEPLAASCRGRANPAPVFSAVKQVDAHKLLTSSGENVFWQAPVSSFTLYLAAARGPPSARSAWQVPPHAFTPQAVACTHVQVCALTFAGACKTSIILGVGRGQKKHDKQGQAEGD